MGAAKVPFFNRRVLGGDDGAARKTKSIMIECDVGGGFGARGEFYPRGLS
jgi:aerobic carbon-monoxide dehydrogenase large subunit